MERKRVRETRDCEKGEKEMRELFLFHPRPRLALETWRRGVFN